MHKIILFLAFFASGVAPTNFTYSGIAGNWTDGTKWTGGISPLTGSTTTGVTISPAVIVSLNNNATINNLTFNASGTLRTVTANTLTMDGTSPYVSGLTGSPTLSVPTSMATDLRLILAGTTNLLIGASVFTNNGHDFRQSTPATSTFNFIQVNGANAGIVGGTYYLDSGTILVTTSTAALGTISSIQMGNAGGVPSWFGTNIAAFNRPIALVDTGTKPFYMSGTASNQSTVTGSITHDFYMTGIIDGNWSGFSTSGSIIPATNGTALTINTSTFPTTKIQTQALVGYPGIGQPTTSSINSSVNLTNNIDFWCLPSNATTANFTANAPITLSGNIVLNPSSSTTTGHLLNLNSTATNKLTISGVISNSAALASRVTVTFGGAGNILTGTNTYTSPTTISGGGELSVNGSIVSAITESTSTAILSGRGTVGAVTANGIVASYSRLVSPAVTDVLTTTGSVTFAAAGRYHVFTSAAPASSKLAITGNVTFTAGAAVVIGAGSVAMTSGQSAVIMTYTGTSTGTLTPPVGYTISDVAGVITLTKT